MKVVKVNKIQFVEKDIVEVKNKADFERINLELFGDSFVFDLNGVLYLIGTEVAYYFDSLKAHKGSTPKKEEVK